MIILIAYTQHLLSMEDFCVKISNNYPLLSRLFIMFIHLNFTWSSLSNLLHCCYDYVTFHEMSER